MNTNKDRRGFKDLSIKEKASIAKSRLLDPECSDLEFSRKHNIDTAALRKIQQKINFDESTAVGELMNRVLAKDNELIDMASGLNLRYLNQVADSKVIKDKQIETADKLVNTAMKRAIVIEGMKSKEGEDKALNVTISF